MEFLILLIPILSFLLTIVIMPKWIRKARHINLMWLDCNKYKKNNVAGSGGLIVVFSFVISVLLYIAIKTFYFNSRENVIEILAILTSILLLSLVGLIDDLLGWQSKGLSKRIRIILCFVAAIPFMVINLDNNVRLLYLFVIIPVGIAGCSLTFNFLAGMNGLEARQGILLIFALSIAAYFKNYSWISLVGLVMITTLLAFLYYNKFPAKVFPGNILTYPVGGLIAMIAILSRTEKFALFIFIPYFIEIFLKSRGKLEKQSFGKPNKDGSLDLLYNKCYSLNHLAIIFLKKMRIKPTEKAVVNLINIFQILIIVIGFVLFKNSIFV